MIRIKGSCAVSFDTLAVSQSDNTIMIGKHVCFPRETTVSCRILGRLTELMTTAVFMACRFLTDDGTHIPLLRSLAKVIVVLSPGISG
jgi:hypothetical protein